MVGRHRSGLAHGRAGQAKLEPAPVGQDLAAAGRSRADAGVDMPRSG
jgi:hypothetical protein